MNLRRLYEHLDPEVRRVMHETAEVAAREGHPSITVELFLLCMLRERGVGPELMRALDRAGGDSPAIESGLAAQVARGPRAQPGTLPAVDGTLGELLRESWALAFDEYGEAAVSPVRCFETVLRRGDRWPKLASALPGLDRVDPARLGAQAQEPRKVATHPPHAAPGAPYRELSRYGEDLIARARSGELDPVIGCEDPWRAIAAILLRRRQNCAVLVGESGVGKTACGLGFVGALARGGPEVPQALADTPVWSLDISALRAGAMVRGGLEERLQSIVTEVEGAGMILFADDLHLLFGEGAQGADALRAILNAGKVRILGTCGWREWRRHVEPDPGLARRMAPVRIAEPDRASALRIVEGAAPALAAHHGVVMGDGVLEGAVALSQRYIVGRRLPDKAIAVLDSACARARIGKRAPEDDSATAKTREAQGGEAPQAAQDAEAEQAPPIEVTRDDAAAVVSDLTGVPTGAMLSDASRSAARLETALAERVVGQDHALARCAAQARAYLAGLSDRRRPVGALMFCGPSGVGKTETAYAVAEALFGGRLLSVNMSEYQEAHTVSGLKGAPAGYVGYGEGGVLTEGIRRTPYCVVLLDEIEKAHADVIEMLYQVLDRGWMEDAEGIEADFSNALIILTTNAADTVVEKAATADPPPREDELDAAIKRALARHFPAAFIGRLQIVPYWPLGEDTLETIAGLRLAQLAENYHRSHRATLEFDETVRTWLAARVKATPQGARLLDGIIAGSIRPAVADHVLDRMGRATAPGDVRVILQDDRFTVEAQGNGEARSSEATAEEGR